MVVKARSRLCRLRKRAGNWEDIKQNNPVIIDIVRSPMGRGKAGGALSGVHPVDLLSQTIQGLLARNPTLDPGLVDDVIVG
jgi:acetyl-CoA C-acetyltransferase/acetyl-CoA acyltransferase